MGTQSLSAFTELPARLTQTPLSWPLMDNNITREDLDALTAFLNQPDMPILTQARQVRGFEQEWSRWLGVKHSLFVTSGSAANLLTLAALRWRDEDRGMHGGEVILPPLTWVSDVAAVLHAGYEPAFVDIRLDTLAMDDEQVLKRLTPHTRAVFLTHVLGYNGLTQRLLNELQARGIPLIEDVCESHGATFNGQKLGTFGLLSNFSFYYAHHMSTIEGGMICTNDDDLYERLRMLRGHGMVRESSDARVRDRYKTEFDTLNPDFIFARAAYNTRATELQAVLGRNQLPRLDDNNLVRQSNLRRFLSQLDARKYFTEFEQPGSSNYAFTLLLRHPNHVLLLNVIQLLTRLGVEFRRGMSGGGNQLRQPYLQGKVRWAPADFPNAEHVHFYGFYLGNYPSLDSDKIDALCQALNALPETAPALA